jgi:thiol:disulfide interchange protein
VLLPVFLLLALKLSGLFQLGRSSALTANKTHAPVKPV